MTNFAPGPLTYEVGEYTGKDWLVAVVEFARGGEGAITTEYVPASAYVRGDVEANLCLWSTAPELYRMLEGARDAITTLPGNEFGIGRDGKPNRDRMLDRIDAVLAKARGDTTD